MLDGKLVMVKLDDLNPRQQQGLKFGAQLAFGVIPKDDAMALKEDSDGSLNLSHAATPASINKRFTFSTLIWLEKRV